jgi:hypothetical protein
MREACLQAYPVSTSFSCHLAEIGEPLLIVLHILQITRLTAAIVPTFLSKHHYLAGIRPVFESVLKEIVQ